MPEITPTDNQPTRLLFRELERSHALVTALFAGCARGRLFVDDPSAPRTGIIVCNSRVLCAGDASQADFLNEMAFTFSDELIPAHLARRKDAYLVYALGEAWETTLKNLFPTYNLYPGRRQYYEITDFAPRPDLHLPNGFSIQLITPEFLSGALAGLDAVREEMCSERASLEDFLRHSFGLCSILSDEI